MGAWGYEPMDDDCAFEWLANEIEAPLLGTIKRTLQAYLDQPEKDDVNTIEAEAAAALLIDLAGGYAKMRYIDLDCGWLVKEEHWLAREGDLLALATTVINRIMQDEPWINNYNEPQEKISVLKRLLADLQHSQERNRKS
ncbi:MAG TPA: DUF4259 domain-containing protein [Gemmataceae bacterium]|jgi:hypothetical protein